MTDVKPRPCSWPSAPRAYGKCSPGGGRETDLIERNRDTAVAAVQSVYYLLTGAWPLVHRRSFERVTGPKSDFWLVEAVGITVAAIGLGLAQAAGRGRPIPPELRSVAAAAAAGLGALEIVYVSRRRISPVYLVDAAIESAFLCDWLRLRERWRGYSAFMERTPDAGDPRAQREQESRDEPKTKYEQQREDERAERERLADELADSEPSEG